MEELNSRNTENEEVKQQSAEAEEIITEIANETETAETAEEPKEKGGCLNDIIEIFESIVISVFVVLLIFTFIARPVTVEGRSMNPTLIDGDKLIMRMIGYTPKVGDIVIIENDCSYTLEEGTDKIVKGDGLNKRLIKRVIATGGQTVDINFDNGDVIVDGEIIEESYIAEKTSYNAKAFKYPVTVPEGYIFVMGDNRNQSTDSRAVGVGFVKEEDVLGEAIVRFYPFSDFKLLD